MKLIHFAYLFTIFLASANNEYDHNISDYCYFNVGQNCRCKDKNLFPLRINELIGSLIIVIFSALSNAAGIGGGEINILIIQFFFLFDTYGSILLAQCITFGGSLMTVFLKVWKRHPAKNRSIIDYDVVSFAISPLLSGTTVGVILHMLHYIDRKHLFLFEFV